MHKAVADKVAKIGGELWVGLAKPAAMSDAIGHAAEFLRLKGIKVGKDALTQYFTMQP